MAEAEALADDSPAGLETYIRQYYRTVSAEDLRERTPADLAGAALAHLQFGRRRQAGTPRLRVYNPAERSHGWSSTHTIVDTVNDDMPFLVDSTTMVPKLDRVMVKSRRSDRPGGPGRSPQE